MTQFDQQADHKQDTVFDVDLERLAFKEAVEHAQGKGPVGAAAALERDVTGRTTIRVGADLGSVERQATPLLAEDLARNITALLADGSW